VEVFHSSFQFFSFARWQITSIEKLNASAKAVHSNHACLPKATTIMAKQNTLAITVKAFFSVRYFFLKGEVDDSNFFIAHKDNRCIHLKKDPTKNYPDYFL